MKNNHQDLQSYFDLMTMNGSAYVFNIAQKMQFLNVFQGDSSLTANQVSSKLKFQEKTV